MAKHRRRPRFDDQEFDAKRHHTYTARSAVSSAFKCRHCRQFIGMLPSGGHHRNHCPNCLYSRHVDGARSGDRASDCGALMAPIGAFVRANGEHVLVHRCLGCTFERHNRIAADDNFALVLALPVLTPRTTEHTERGDTRATDFLAGGHELSAE